MKRTQKQAHELSLLELLQAMRVSDEATCSLFVVRLTNDQSLSQGRCDDERQMGGIWQGTLGEDLRSHHTVQEHLVRRHTRPVNRRTGDAIGIWRRARQLAQLRAREDVKARAVFQRETHIRHPCGHQPVERRPRCRLSESLR